MILLLIRHIESVGTALRSAYTLSVRLKKELGLLMFVGEERLIDAQTETLRSFADRQQLPSGLRLFVRAGGLESLGELCETLEASFLVVQSTDSRPRHIQSLLNACRDLRIPYLLFKDSFAELRPERVLVPVTFLEEEYEKAQFASAFGRFYGSHVLLLQADDYGSKARTTTEKIGRLLDKFGIDYQVEKARGDSFKVEKEAVRRAMSEEYGLVLLSASRDYGPDDLLFGPKERHLARRSTVPLLLINPRGDLYALCE